MHHHCCSRVHQQLAGSWNWKWRQHSTGVPNGVRTMAPTASPAAPVLHCMSACGSQNRALWQRLLQQHAGRSQAKSCMLQLKKHVSEREKTAACWVHSPTPALPMGLQPAQHQALSMSSGGRRGQLLCHLSASQAVHLHRQLESGAKTFKDIHGFQLS